jgi:Fic family protein
MGMFSNQISYFALLLVSQINFTLRKINFNILPADLLSSYSKEIHGGIEKKFEQLRDNELSIATFSFYTSVSAVFSSKIEGENIELDSYIKYKRLGAHFLSDYTKKIDDLYDAYLFGQRTKLSAETLQQAHALITRHILQKSQRGKFRKGNMFVLTADGRIEYVAASPDTVKTDMKKFYADIDLLLATKINFEEVLFFASLLHLVFVKIHPFEDGNGRTARLLEKWFIAEKSGVKAWFIQSEKYYYTQHQTYYNNIRLLGLEYETLDYSKALPFLLMLPAALA